jgi:anti-sigma B factor antagonist
VNAPLDVKVEHGDVAARVVVAGEVDLATADRLREGLRSALGSDRPVIVDLSDCNFIDSIGLSVLIDAAHRAERSGRVELGIASPSASVRRLIELTQLESLIPVFDSTADAAASFAAS